jgi:hypothetical protein
VTKIEAIKAHVSHVLNVVCCTDDLERCGWLSDESLSFDSGMYVCAVWKDKDGYRASYRCKWGPDAVTGATTKRHTSKQVYKTVEVAKHAAVRNAVEDALRLAKIDSRWNGDDADFDDAIGRFFWGASS